MTIPKASKLVLQAAAMGDGGEIFISDMGPPITLLNSPPPFPNPVGRGFF